MSVIHLLREARERIDENKIRQQKSVLLFTSGAKWLHAYLNVPEAKTKKFPLRNYELYGWTKYAFSLLIALLWVYLFASKSPAIALLSVIIFYIVEVHFLFLFPLAITGKDQLLFRSVRATYTFGFWKAFFYTVCIAGYMLVGLLNVKDPIINWRTGCLAILLLYQGEVRDRT